MGISAGIIAALVAVSLAATYITWKTYKTIKKEPKGWKPLRQQHRAVLQFLQLQREAKARANESTTKPRVPLNIIGAEGSPATRTAVRLGTPHELPAPGVPQVQEPPRAHPSSSNMFLKVELARAANELPDIEVVDLDYHEAAPTKAGEADAATEGQADATTEGQAQESAEKNSESEPKWSVRWWT